jgi:AcrR family transcriptional regulator
MNSKERYISVYNDRNKLDRVPTFVQHFLNDFTDMHKNTVLSNKGPGPFDNPYLDIPYLLGFESIFAFIPSPLKFHSTKVKLDDGSSVRIKEDGQLINRQSTYYEGGYINSLDILNDIKSNQRIYNREKEIKQTLVIHDKASPKIFPVIAVDGIFDHTWQAMGMNVFSRNFRKKTKLYRELVKFYAEIAKINIQALIENKEDRVLVVNILDDLAFKGRTMISPQRWNEDFLPLYKEITSMISDAGMIPQIHTDGDVTEIIPSLIKAGFKGLQGWEGGCDPYYINDNFPDFVIIGFVDVHKILPFGTKEEIENHVIELMDALKENRHFIIGPSTVIFKEIPLKNVELLINSVRKYGQY